MKKLYQHGGDRSLSLGDILDETNQLDVEAKISQWLRTEALANNPKVEVSSDGKYTFKPPHEIRDRKGLIKLLRHYDLKGLGGILLDDVTESLPNYDKVLKQLNKGIGYITRP